MPLPLFDQLTQLEERLDGHSLFLCLDYDGTLVPIAFRPELAKIGEKERASVQKLMEAMPVAVISGRALGDIQHMLGLEEVIYAGNHGLEIRAKDFHHEEAGGRVEREVLSEVLIFLEEAFAGMEGVWVEDKGVTASVHFRLTPRDLLPQLQRNFWEVLKPYVDEGKVKVTPGKEVLEVRPPLDWHKGKAVEYLLAQPSLSGRVPIYIGDDETDEDAFESISDTGVSIGVGADRQEGQAHYLLKDTFEVYKFLDWLLKRSA